MYTYLLVHAIYLLNEYHNMNIKPTCEPKGYLVFFSDFLPLDIFCLRILTLYILIFLALVWTHI